MSSRASSMLRQTRVPTSTTEVCISALTRSCRRSLALGQHLGLDVRAQVARDRIDGLVFLFDAEREGGAHGCS